MLTISCILLYIFLGVLVSRIGVKIIRYNAGYECDVIDIVPLMGMLWPITIIVFIGYAFVKMCNHFISWVTNNKI